MVRRIRWGEVSEEGREDGDGIYHKDQAYVIVSSRVF